jgi:hypothetical protein
MLGIVILSEAKDLNHADSSTTEVVASRVAEILRCAQDDIPEEAA